MSGPVPDGSDRGPGSLQRHLAKVFGSEAIFKQFVSTVVATAVEVVNKSKLSKRADKLAEFAESQMAMNAAFADGFKGMAQQLALAERHLAMVQKMIEDRAEISALLPGRIRALESRLADLEAAKADHAGS